MTTSTKLDPTATAEVVREFLPRQRWFAGTEAPATVTVRDHEVFRRGEVELLWLLVDADGETYQLVAGLEQGRVVLDEAVEPERALALLDIVTSGAESAERVRPMGVEQSNTSLVYDDRLVLKVFRRVAEGPNPDVEVTTALATVGFKQVAEPLATWRRDERDLAIVQRYLSGAAEGWALAVASLRDLYTTRVRADDSGGDFAAESGRVGELTAELHLALALAFGAERPSGPPAWLDTVAARVRAGCGARADAVIGQLRALADGGALVRVHGDYHLGQLVRTDAGWFVLDFEGEPSRPLEQRRQPVSPLKDISGMLRSFQYAAEVVRAEHEPAERDALEPVGQAWEARNRQAFLDGYLGVDGIAELLPGDPASLALALRAFELEKAVYELDYERAHRPDWAAIPEAAITRLLAG